MGFWSGPSRTHNEEAPLALDFRKVENVALEVYHQTFRSSFKSWEALLEDAADWASDIPPDRLISISHSCDRGDGVVVIWYWDDDDEYRRGKR